MGISHWETVTRGRVKILWGKILHQTSFLNAVSYLFPTRTLCKMFIFCSINFYWLVANLSMRRFKDSYLVQTINYELLSENAEFIFRMSFHWLYVRPYLFQNCCPDSYLDKNIKISIFEFSLMEIFEKRRKSRS